MCVFAVYIAYTSTVSLLICSSTVISIFIRVLDIRVQHAWREFSISPKRLSRALIELKVIFIDEPQQLELPLQGTITWDPPNPEVRKIIDSKKMPAPVGGYVGNPRKVLCCFNQSCWENTLCLLNFKGFKLPQWRHWIVENQGCYNFSVFANVAQEFFRYLDYVIYGLKETWQKNHMFPIPSLKIT